LKFGNQTISKQHPPTKEDEHLHSFSWLIISVVRVHHIVTIQLQDDSSFSWLCCSFTIQSHFSSWFRWTAQIASFAQGIGKKTQELKSLAG